MSDCTPEETREHYADAATNGVCLGTIVSATGFIGLVMGGKQFYARHHAERALEQASAEQRAGLEEDVKDASAVAWGSTSIGLVTLLIGAAMFGISKHFFTLDKKGYFGK